MTMWMVFDTQAEAQTYADAATAALPHGPGDVTAQWDAPRELADGRGIVAATSGGVEWQEDWAMPQGDTP